MSVQIQRLSDGVIQIKIGETILSSDAVKVIRPALMRHITELSAAIEGAAANSAAQDRREQAIKERRSTFQLMEYFDMVMDEVNSVQAWLGIQAMQLENRDIQIFGSAMRLFRDHWVSAGTDGFSAAEYIIHLLDDQ